MGPFTGTGMLSPVSALEAFEKSLKLGTAFKLTAIPVSRRQR